MQDNAMSRWLSPLMAFCLSFIIIATLAPILGIGAERQLDFWLLWLASMLVLALPITYMEVALAKRSKSTALNALSSLTRDADASAQWRLVGWLAVVFMPFLAGGMLFNASNMLTQLTELSHLPVFIALAVVALALSLAPRQIIVLLTLLGVLASLVLSIVMGDRLPTWQFTALEFSEWGAATVLALVASGLGLGVYSQVSLSHVKQADAATHTVLPVWIAQLLAVVAFGFFIANTQIPALAFVVSVVTGSALLMSLARQQLAERQMAAVIQWAVLAVAVLVWAIPMFSGVFNIALLLWGLSICLIYAIFAGWMMKISHLRKALNFSSEAVYNLWRIAMRIVLPLAIVVAMIALIGKVLS